MDRNPLVIDKHPWADAAGAFVKGTFLVGLRGIAAALYTLLAMGEFFLAPLLCGFALLVFGTTMLFGFILEMHFPQRWQVLGCSVLIMFAYFAYRALMELVLWVARGPR